MGRRLWDRPHTSWGNYIQLIVLSLAKSWDLEEVENVAGDKKACDNLLGLLLPTRHGHKQIKMNE